MARKRAVSFGKAVEMFTNLWYTICIPIRKPIHGKEKGEFPMPVQKINAESFEALKTQEKTVLLDFYADWCGPCRMLSPVVDEIAKEREDILVGKINVDECPELAQAFGVVSIPTLVVMKQGNVLQQSTGVRPKAQILAMLEG